VIRVESGGRTILFGRPITSTAGAMGLMQLMRDTYNEMRTRNGLGADPYDARDNILAGTAYLHELYTKYGYPQLFAAYNAGPGRLEDHLHKGHALPAETRTYVRLATDGAVGSSFGEVKPATKKGVKMRVAALYQPAS
jgi:soluble lytic murein transglycosylase-like protein